MYPVSRLYRFAAQVKAILQHKPPDFGPQPDTGTLCYLQDQLGDIPEDERMNAQLDARSLTLTKVEHYIYDTRELELKSVGF
jgi:hypothetical protein